MQLLPMASSPDGLISARYAVITKTPGWEVLTTGGGGGGSDLNPSHNARCPIQRLYEKVNDLHCALGLSTLYTAHIRHLSRLDMSAFPRLLSLIGALPRQRRCRHMAGSPAATHQSCGAFLWCAFERFFFGGGGFGG